MAITFGFFDSLNGDRKYNARQIASLFDGIISDGVISAVGSAFAVSPSSGGGLTVNVGTGRAWFDHTWILNDAELPLTLDSAEAILSRIDAIVLEINSNLTGSHDSVSARSANIIIVKGTASSTPVVPTIQNDSTDPGIHQYILATVTLAAGVTDITQAMITSYIGSAQTPLCTGLLQQMTIDQIVAQWGDEFNSWFEGLDIILDGDVATHLAAEVTIDPTTITLYEDMGWDDPDT